MTNQMPHSKSELIGSHDPVLIRGELLGLIFDCPLKGGNPTYCSTHHIRKRSVEDRLKWLESLSDKECMEIYTEHKGCLAAQKLS